VPFLYILTRIDGREATEHKHHHKTSNTTSSYDTFQLAQRWLHECITSHTMCRHVSPDTNWYPTRLIDMGLLSEHNRVRIVEPREQEDKIEGRYVTLSHCWGNIDFYHLTQDTLPVLKEGIGLEELPKTFRHAIDFACRLGLRYIWIDSLCILQDSERDWLYQSAQMDQVYNHSLCNISATAAENSTKGLYFDRLGTQVWVDDVYLKTDGISGRDDITPSPKDAKTPPKDTKPPPKDTKPLPKNTNPPPKNTKPLPKDTKPLPKDSKPLPKYTILDLSFWEQNVDDAPINKRAWVLQERLIAPRVLHFCQDQIAWECWEKDCIESRPDGLPLLQLKAGSILDGSRLKGMVPRLDGKALREMRLDKTKAGKRVDLDEHLLTAIPSLYCYELWKRVVEVYSKTRLTKSADKLIALAGIAKIFSRRILNGKDEDYIAGMWRRHLESQLLWRVDPALENGSYDFHSDRPTYYRAPSFSWAAVDTERGIKYADATDYGDAVKEDLYIEIEKIQMQRKTDDRFGMVIGGHIILKGVLKKIQVVDSKSKGYTRYHWLLSKDGRTLDHAYKMIYLDAPSSDCPSILGPHGGVYCLPVSRDRSAPPQELICLLLKSMGGKQGIFRRVGLTKISRYHENEQEEVQNLSLSGDESQMPCPWDASAKKHTIRII